MDRNSPEDESRNWNLAQAERARQEAHRLRRIREVKLAVLTTVVVVLVALLMFRPLRDMVRNMARSAKPETDAAGKPLARSTTSDSPLPTTDNPPPASDLPVLLAAAEDASAKTPTAALRLYRRAATTLPNDHRVWLGQAKCAARAGDVQFARASFEEAVKLAPNDVGVRVAYAEFAWSQADCELAVAQAQVAIGLDAASLDARFAAVQALLQAQRASEALPHMRRALELAPDHGRVHLLLGRTLLGMDRLDEAQTALLRAAELAPASAQTKLALAELRRRQSRPDEAAELLAQAQAQAAEQEKQPRMRQIASRSTGGLAGIPARARLSSTATLRTRIQLERAEVLVAAGKQTEAIDSLRKLLTIHPDLVQARTRLGELLLAVGRDD